MGGRVSAICPGEQRCLASTRARSRVHARGMQRANTSRLATKNYLDETEEARMQQSNNQRQKREPRQSLTLGGLQSQMRSVSIRSCKNSTLLIHRHDFIFSFLAFSRLHRLLLSLSLPTQFFYLIRLCQRLVGSRRSLPGSTISSR